MPDGDPTEHLDTTAITTGRTHSRDSLAPVLFPSTTYEVESVAEHAAMVGSSRTDRLYSRFGSPTVADLEEAVGIAAEVPIARYTAIEVRELRDIPEH